MTIKSYNEYIKEASLWKEIKSILGNIFSKSLDNFKKSMNVDSPKVSDVKQNIIDVITNSCNAIIKSIDANINTDDDINNTYNDFLTQLSKYEDTVRSELKNVLKPESYKFALNTSSAIINGIIKYYNDPEVKKKVFDVPLANAKGIDNKKKALKAIIKNINKSSIDNINKINDNDLIKNAKVVQATNSNIKDKLKIGTKVTYKRNGYDNSKKPNDQPNKVGTLPIKNINGSKITFTDSQGKDFIKDISDILSISDTGNLEEDVAKLQHALGEIKGDKTKIDQILNYTEFLKSNNQEANKKINDIINNG